MTAAAPAVALLRAINLGSHNPMPMAELRALCESLGWKDVRTWIQSGNVVFLAAGAHARLESKLEAAIRRRFGFDVPVVIRDAPCWAGLVRVNPFPDECETEPNRVMLLLSKEPPLDGAEAAIRERARDGERVARAADALWIHYPAGAGASRITPGLLDRFVGSAVTTRNWRTVLKIAAMLDA